MLTRAAVIAASRFGLGARADEAAALNADPPGWLQRQLAPHAPLPADLAGLPPAKSYARDILQSRVDRRRADAETMKLIAQRLRPVYIEEMTLRTAAMVRSDMPYRERLVAFWSNHFTVSARRPVVAAMTGGFEREAIRPHVTGRFFDMLLAATRHPAMLFFLDNLQSIGPESRAGQRTGRGLNENHARELLELHTVGLDAGYSQADVRALAKILTGWSIGRLQRDPDPGAYRFQPLAHEPGTKTLLGRSFREDGEAEGVAALRFLAGHPATARHIAGKLARHFVADQPPAAVIDRLAKLFRDTDGDLGAMARGLIDLPEAWDEPLGKIRTPQDYVIAALRATGSRIDGPVPVQWLNQLGQPPFGAPSPAGWPDRAADWISPEAALHRVEWATALARRSALSEHPTAIADRTLGAAMSGETRQIVTRAESATEGLALLLASPEFQRR